MDSAILQFMMTYAQHVNSIFSQKKSMDRKKTSINRKNLYKSLKMSLCCLILGNFLLGIKLLMRFQIHFHNMQQWYQAR